MPVNTPSQQMLWPNDRRGVYVEVPDGPAIDGIFYITQGGKTFKRIVTGTMSAVECGIYGNGSDMSTRLQAALSHTGITTLLFNSNSTADITISGSVTVPAGKTLRFEKGNRIIGTGSITGGIIDAGDMTECVSATFNFRPAGSAKRYYSCRWFGCKGDGAAFDNIPIQKIWDFITANPENAKPVYFPAGNYLHDNGTLVYLWTGTNYAQCMIKIMGEKNTQSGSNAFMTTRFTCTSNMADKFILGVQFGRQIEISNIHFTGRYTLPTTFTLLQVITHPIASWAQSGVRDTAFSPHTCLNFDPFRPTVPSDGGYSTGGWGTFYRGSGTSGTSQAIISGCRFEQTPVGAGFSINQNNLNCEMVKVEDSSFAYNKVCVAYGQAQTKENLFNNNRVWERCRTIIDCANYGSSEGAPPYINGLNIAGAAFQLIHAIAPFELHARDIYAETIGRIGILETAVVQHSIQDSLFHFATGAGLFPSMDFIVSGKVTFDGCNMQYYDGGFQRLKLTKPNNAIAMRGGALTRLPMTACLATSEDLKYVKLDSVHFWGEGGAIYNDTANVTTWNLLKNTPMFGLTAKGTSTAGSNASMSFIYNETKYDDQIVLETTSITKNLDGTCTITVTNATLEKIQVNDMLISDVTMAWKYWEDANLNDPMPVLGRITGIVGNVVSLQGAAINVPNGTTANVPIYVNFIRYFNAPLVGNLTSGSPTITSVEYLFGFTPNAGIRLEHPFIPKGTKVVSTTANSITLSANCTGTMNDASIINGRPDVTMYINNSPVASTVVGYLIEGAIMKVIRGSVYANEGDRYYVNKSVLSTSSTRPVYYSPLNGGYQRITLAMMKQGAGALDLNTTYFLTDTGKEGMFIIDPADTTTANNDATVIVANGARFKRVVSNNFYDARWFGNATRTFSSTGDATTKIAAAYRFIGLTVLVETAGAVDEYWWKAGTADGQLVLK